MANSLDLYAYGTIPQALQIISTSTTGLVPNAPVLSAQQRIDVG
jgi:hypothetical protein